MTVPGSGRVSIAAFRVPDPSAASTPSFMTPCCFDTGRVSMSSDARPAATCRGRVALAFARA